MSKVKGWFGSATLAISVMLAVGCGGRAGAPRALTLDEVEARLGQPGVHVYDANPREMYDDKHLPGARWIAWDEVTAQALPPDRSATLIFYCALEQCSASHEAAAAAVKLGFRNVFVMPQGILGWKKAGKPLERPRG